MKTEEKDLSNLKNLPVAGWIVIVVILALFALSIVLLFYLSARYRLLAGKAKGDGRDESGRGFRALLSRACCSASGI